MTDTPRWDNLPAPVTPTASAWHGFSADPRRHPELRASDADRSRAAAMLSSAYAEGRLDQAEYNLRLSEATSARELGALVPMLNDLVVDQPAPNAAGYVQPAAPVAAPTPSEQNRFRRIAGSMPSWWIRLAVIFNVIWLVTVMTSGHPLYYWPIWPMLGTAVPVILTWSRRAGRGAGRMQAEQGSTSGALPPAGGDLR